MTDPTPTFDTPPKTASVALPSVPLTSTPPVVASDYVPAPPPVRVKPEHLATQTVYPWRAAVRAGGATFLGFLLAAAAITADPAFDAFVGRYVPGAVGGVVGFGAFCGALALLISRLSNIPAVTSLLTRLHLGPIPKH